MNNKIQEENLPKNRSDITHVFPGENVFIKVPEKSGEGDIYVTRKQPNYELESTPPDNPTFKRVVINFGIYCLNKFGKPIQVQRFEEPLEIWVGYTVIEKESELKYLVGDGALLPIDIIDRIEEVHWPFVGYAYAKLETWPTDPNVGWV